MINFYFGNLNKMEINISKSLQQSPFSKRDLERETLLFKLNSITVSPRRQRAGKTKFFVQNKFLKD